MKKPKVFTSKKNIIKLVDFLSLYLEIELNDFYKYCKNATGSAKLTHGLLKGYMFEKGLGYLRRYSFDDVCNEDIICGNCVLVKDEQSHTIPYSNPKRMAYDSLLEELNTKKSKLKAAKKRLEILDEMGYTEFDGEVMTKKESYELQVDDLFVNNNRNKVRSRRKKK